MKTRFTPSERRMLYTRKMLKRNWHVIAAALTIWVINVGVVIQYLNK